LNLPFLLLAALGIGTAQAAPPPAVLPTRDVSVSYVLSAPGRPTASYQLAFDAAGQRARIDDPARGTFFLVDLRSGQAQLVLPMLHTVVDAPNLSTISQEIAQARDARFTTIGPGSYAGLGCEKYLVLNAQGSAEACLTPDGVALHFHGRDTHGAAEVTATSVTYAPANPADFSPPAGFGSVTLPPGALDQLLRQQ
jgi:hypothetical protein